MQSSGAQPAGNGDGEERTDARLHEAFNADDARRAQGIVRGATGSARINPKATAEW